MTKPEHQPPADDATDAAADDSQKAPREPSPHEKPPPENPPVDEYDLERGKANLDRVIPK